MAAILIVDDDDATRLLVKTVLSHAGHRVIEACDGQAAIELVGREDPDLVLLDLHLPGMSGAEFMRAVRAEPQTSGTRVALYTASMPTPALRDFMEIYGIAGCIPKPAGPHELIEAVEQSLASAPDEKKL